jgi:hypothetical protein
MENNNNNKVIDPSGRALLCIGRGRAGGDLHILIIFMCFEKEITK